MRKTAGETDEQAVQAGPDFDVVRDQPDHLDAAPLDLGAGLVQVSFLVQGIYQRVSERHHLTPAQAKLLCMVAEAPRGMTELAQCFGVEKAALTGLVDRAERRGLAQRSAVPGDRRALCVAPTDAGCRAAIAFEAEVAAELDRLVSGLSLQDREHLRRMLAEIVTEVGHPDSRVIPSSRGE